MCLRAISRIGSGGRCAEAAESEPPGPCPRFEASGGERLHLLLAKKKVLGAGLELIMRSSTARVCTAVHTRS